MQLQLRGREDNELIYDILSLGQNIEWGKSVSSELRDQEKVLDDWASCQKVADREKTGTFP